jgi:hypothetical protein
MPHTLPLRFHVPTKTVQVFVVEYSESLGGCEPGGNKVTIRRAGHLASKAARTVS